MSITGIRVPVCWRGASVLLASLLSLGARAEPAPSVAGHYRLDPAHSFVHFEVMHFRTSTLRGRIGPVEGHVTLDPGGPGNQASIVVPMARLDTGVKPLDVRLARPDLLGVEEHPKTWFVARDFEWQGEQLVAVRGELTLKGIARSVKLRAQRFQCYTNPRLQQQVCGGDFETELLRGDYGMNFGVPFVADRVRVLLQVEGVRD